MDYIDENDIPVKMFVAGPPKAGKTTLLLSLFNHLSTEKNSNGGFWEEKYISKHQMERTISLTLYSKALIGNTPFVIYDLGGQECYYALQAVFLDLENSFFLTVFDLTKDKEELRANIVDQLAIVSSKLPQNAKAEVIFIGTHLDLMNDEDKQEKLNICKKALVDARHNNQNLKIVKKIFMDATEENSKEIQELIEACEASGANVHGTMVNSDKFMIPFVLVESFFILRLQMPNVLFLNVSIVNHS